MIKRMTEINRDELVCWFIDRFPHFYSDMLESQHYVDKYQPNIFHVEGSVWTHTMMAMTWVEANRSKYSVEDYVILLTSAMLHDLGKPTCEEENEATETKPIRNSFKGHEGVSVMYSISVLKKLKEDFPDVYTDDIIELIIKVIGTHGVALDDGDCRFTMLREQFRITDKSGAVRKVNEGMFAQYSGRKFASNKNVVPEKEIVFMVGHPCSGKSEYFKNNFKGKGYAHLSRDLMLEDYYYKEFGNTETYSEMYKTIHKDDGLSKGFESFYQENIRTFNKAFDKIVVDMTMMPMSSRRKMMNKFPKHTRKVVVLMTDVDTLKERNKVRTENGKHIPSHVFFNMAKSFVYPVEAEGFTDIKLVIN